MRTITPLTEYEKERYGWQLNVRGHGETGQEKLKAATVLVSRVGGLGGLVAYELAAAGVGKIIIAHGGILTVDDLNRQLLMTDDWIGKPRVECAAKRLKELNPHIEIKAVPENISEQNAASLVEEADVVVDCAPLFVERYAMNREVVRQNKVLVDCAMFNLEAQVTTIVPGKTPCLRCLYPENPPAWKRRFPVFGAVSGTVGCIGAMEAIKVISGFGEPLYNTLLCMDLESMLVRRMKIKRNPNCSECSSS
ncbi:MAG: HesA/MoeB/ThiF family protein [Fibrobacteres bacterium]|nr:HesA/MoeB/ThiF family protein [Fibrobacterota bacterium]